MIVIATLQIGVQVFGIISWNSLQFQNGLFEKSSELHSGIIE